MEHTLTTPDWPGRSGKGKLENGNWNPGEGNWKMENGNRKLETGTRSLGKKSAHFLLSLD